MKIVYVLEYYYPHVGGVETLFQTVAEAMVKLGHSVVVYTSRLPNTLRNETRSGVRIIRLSVPPIGQRYFFTFFAPLFIWPAIRKADVVHTTTYNAAWPGWLVATVFRRPVVLSIQEVWIDLWRMLPSMPWWSAWLHGLYERFIYSLPYARVVVGSQHTAEAVKRANPKYHPEVVYHGVAIPAADPTITRETIRREWRTETTDFVLLYFGRPGWAKGIEIAVQGFALAIRERPNLKFVLQLSKNPLDRYQQIIHLLQELHLQEQVTIVPSCPRDQLASHILAADTVIVPSLSEGFGFSAAEACLLGQSVVVSQAASLPEVVSGRVVFFSPGDIRACAQAIIAASQGQWLHLPRKTFPWENTIANFVRIYSEVIDRRPVTTMEANTGTTHRLK
ncbi:MAG: glycosyltransferase family 4 protein [Patescibacteria group bacterium]